MLDSVIRSQIAPTSGVPLGSSISILMPLGLVSFIAVLALIFVMLGLALLSVGLFCSFRYRAACRLLRLVMELVRFRGI